MRTVTCMEQYYSTGSAAHPCPTGTLPGTIQDSTISPCTILQQASTTLDMLYLTIGCVIRSSDLRSCQSYFTSANNLNMTHVPRQIGKVAVGVLLSLVR
jgi:hypothetical protein